MKYVMFMRGINVGGIKVPMAELRVVLADLGLQEVTTFLQTGNVVFESDETIADLKPEIEAALAKAFNYEAFVLLYPFDFLVPTIAACPFTDHDDKHAYIILCADQATVAELMACEGDLDPELEAIVAGDQVVYWQVDKGRTLQNPFSKVLAKPKYKATTTNRNLNTLHKIVAE